MERTPVSGSDWLGRLLSGSYVQHFRPEPIPEEVLETVLKAACQTASPWNLQPWQFIVARSDSGRQLVLRHCAEAGPGASAPVLLVGLGDPRAWKRAPARLAELAQSGGLPPGTEHIHLERIRRQWGVGETAQVLAIAQTHAALQQLSLAALAHNVCSWWIREFDATELARALHIPSNLIVVAVVALGYCDRHAAVPGPSLARTVFAEAYGLPWISSPEKNSG